MTTPRTGLGERSERRAGSCSCHESIGMGWCAGQDGDQAAPPSLGPFLCNRRGAFFCVRRPRKSPRTEARAEFHVAGVVRDRSLSSFNEVDQEKSPLARTCRSPPQPAAARRSPPQPAAARRSARHDRHESILIFLRAVACSTQLDANNATLLRVVWRVLSIRS